MLFNQNITSRALTFLLDLVSYIQHNEWIEKRRKSLKKLFHTQRMINQCLLSFQLANTRSTKWNIKNCGKLIELEMMIMPIKFQSVTPSGSSNIKILIKRARKRESVRRERKWGEKRLFLFHLLMRERDRENARVREFMHVRWRWKMERKERGEREKKRVYSSFPLPAQGGAGRKERREEK